MNGIANMKNRRKGTCMTAGCGNEGLIIRGLCPNCYQGAKRMVQKGHTTWHELEEKGLAKEANRERITSSLMTKTIEKMIVDRLEN